MTFIFVFKTFFDIKTTHHAIGIPVPNLLASSGRKKAHRRGLFCGGLFDISGVIHSKALGMLAH